jgi:hypothetical protein
MRPPTEPEEGFPFCGNVHCELHVCVGDPGVEGLGNWAMLESGHIIGRGLYGAVFLCDRCGRALLNGDKGRLP